MGSARYLRYLQVPIYGNFFSDPIINLHWKLEVLLRRIFFFFFGPLRLQDTEVLNTVQGNVIMTMRYTHNTYLVKEYLISYYEVLYTHVFV